MATFLILVTQPAYDTDTSLQVHRFVSAALAQQHSVIGVFFHQAGVSHGNSFMQPLTDEPNHLQHWQDIQQAGVPLLVCATAASRRGIQEKTLTHQQHSAAHSELIGNLHSCFSMSGLTEFAALSAKATRVVQF